jgi:hypothetical protein
LLPALCTAALPLSFSVYYDVIGTGHSNGCTYSAVNGEWRLNDSHCFDQFETSSPGPPCFSPSHVTYLWIGWSQFDKQTSFLYVFDENSAVKTLGMSWGRHEDFGGLIATNGADQGF